MNENATPLMSVYNRDISQLPEGSDLVPYLVLEAPVPEVIDYVLDNDLFPDGFVLVDNSCYPYPC